MRSNSFSVTNNVTKDYLEQISTKGYGFTWEVAVDGYEWQDKSRLYFNWESYGALSTKDSVVGEYLQQTRYRQDYIFMATDRHLPYPEPNHAQPPWLVIKGDLDLSLHNAIHRDSFKDWKFSPTYPAKPLSNPALHRRFASIDTQNLEKEVIIFANKNGFLGRNIPLWVMPPREHPALPIEHDKEGLVHGESLYTWREEIENIGVLLAIWEFIHQEEHGKLGQIIHWCKDYVEIMFKWRHQKGQFEISKWDGREKDGNFGHVHEVIAGKLETEFFDKYARGYNIGPAWYWLGEKINSNLHFIRPKLTGYNEPEVTYVPRTLLDALWLLFMLEVGGKFKFARCKYCDNWFDYERSTKSFCSDNHRRLYFYHHKQKKEAQNER